MELKFSPFQKKLFGMLHIYFIEHVNFIQIIGAQFMIIILGLEIMHWYKCSSLFTHVCLDIAHMRRQKNCLLNSIDRFGREAKLREWALLLSMSACLHRELKSHLQELKRVLSGTKKATPPSATHTPSPFASSAYCKNVL